MEGSRAAATKPTAQWIRGASEESCAKSCAAVGLKCWPESLQTVGSQPAGIGCGLPFLSGCSPAVQATSDRCYYRHAKCDSTSPLGCLTTLKKANSEGRAMLCPCGSEADYAAAHPGGKGVDTGGKSSGRILAMHLAMHLESDFAASAAGAAFKAGVGGGASHSAGSSGPRPGALALLLAVACAIGAAVGSEGRVEGGRNGVGGDTTVRRAGSWTPLRTAVLLGLVLVASMAPAADAHNWAHSEMRSRRKAQGTKPCPARVGDRFGVQVGHEQEFAVAWATGHGANATVLIVRGDKLHLVGRDTIDIARRYMDAAPNGARKTELKWKRQHGSPKNPPHTTDAAKFMTLVPESDPLFHMPKIVLDTEPTTKIFQIADERTKDDIHVTYENKDMAHVTMAGFFKISEVNFGEFDQIRLAMPKWADPGHYVMLWDWQGYADCVDIELRTKPVVSPYGEGSGKKQYERVDHCQLVRGLGGGRRDISRIVGKQGGAGGAGGAGGSKGGVCMYVTTPLHVQ